MPLRVFVAGGTGAIGRLLLPQLVQGGHEVLALTRSPGHAAAIEAAGASAIVADALDRERLTAAVVAAAPDVIIHQLTALARVGNFRRFDEELELTNRFRTEVTDTLLAAARRVNARRFIAQSFCGWTFAREGSAVKSEDDPLDPDPPGSFRRSLAAIRYLEDAVRASHDVGGVALRYGFFYGPGTAISGDGGIVRMIRGRRLPLVGDGGGIWSFVHIADAARATVNAISRGESSLYNVADDDPAPVFEWLPFLAQAVGARRPVRVPAWLARLPLGEGGVALMTKNRGASNARARHDLAWHPAYASWRTGFLEGLG